MAWMTKKKERSFLTELKKSFQGCGAFFHKITDFPHFQGMATRFDLAKPFDAFVILGGRAIAIEAKSMNDFQAFGMRHLRDCQVKGLDEVSAAHGEAYVFLNVRRAGNKEKGVTRVNRLFMFQWDYFKAHCEYHGSFKKVVLESGDFPKIRERPGVKITDGAKGLFPLGDWF